ncbi:MAG TPA: AAA family ATPase [Planctomycetota bacterium]|nr:AAA family ATPase [Planctomycetota bacterium]
MEGLLSLASEFLQDRSATGRGLEVDRAREQRLAGLTQAVDGFRQGKAALDELVKTLAAAVREQQAGSRRPGTVWLWGFKNEDERAFPERLAQAGSRVPEADLKGVLATLLKDAESMDDEERVQRLLAFADFVADLDSRGQEGDPRLGVGPSANFLTFAWHLLGDGREPVFLFETNKAIKAVSEASQDPALVARDLEGRFRAFYAVARRLAPALAPAPVPMRQGWAVEHFLEWTLERMGALPQSGTTEDPGSSGLWKPRPRAELKDRPPSGRLPVQIGANPGTVAPTRPSITIQPPRRTESMPVAKIAAEPPPEKPIETQKTERIFAIGKAKTIIAQDPVPERKEEPKAPEVREITTPRPLPKLVARSAAPAAAAPPLHIEGPRIADEPAPARPKTEPAVVKPSPPPAPPAPKPEPAPAALRGEPSPPAPAPKPEPAPAPPPPADPKAVTAPQKRPKADTSGELLTAALGELIGEIATAESDPEERAESTQGTSDTWRSERLSRDLGVSEKLVQDALDALATRGRVLLTGVAATGKTYLARRIALHIAARDERTTFLRLHPSLGYDELVEGRRPDGSIERGIVRELCERARKERDARFAVVLDDVDKGDLTGALGELAGALLERGSVVQLGRSRDKVAFPKNLHVIATARMAPPGLLGRFPCVAVEPDPEALRRFFARAHSALEWVSDLLRQTNERLAKERGGAARLGHGLLMDPELDVARLEGIWRREVLPVVRALGLDTAGFELSALRR